MLNHRRNAHPGIVQLHLTKRELELVMQAVSGASKKHEKFARDTEIKTAVYRSNAQQEMIYEARAKAAAFDLLEADLFEQANA